LPRSVAAEIDSSGQRDAVVVSAVSFWEIGSLVQKNRLRLTLPFRQWVEQTLSRPGFVAMDLTVDIAVESTTLPRGMHPDPADRFLVATARALDATLVTHDRRILAYGEAGYVKVLAA
jgi:PIN domain nuclease of toxin-antitoxin system